MGNREVFELQWDFWDGLLRKRILTDRQMDYEEILEVGTGP